MRRKSLPVPVKSALALGLSAALGLFAFRPDAGRLPAFLQTWSAWKLALSGSGAEARKLLDEVKPGNADDAAKLAFDRATLSALSGSWEDAAFGFAALAANSGSASGEAKPAVPPEETFFQLGNALYRLGESEEGDGRLNYWAMAVGAYGKSLAARYRQETWDNRAFVLEKLKEEAVRQGKATPRQGGGDGRETASGGTSDEDRKSFEERMRDAGAEDARLRKWLRQDGKAPETPQLPSEILRDLFGGGSGRSEEKKDW